MLNAGTNLIRLGSLFDASTASTRCARRSRSPHRTASTTATASGTTRGPARRRSSAARRPTTPPTAATRRRPCRTPSATSCGSSTPARSSSRRRTPRPSRPSDATITATPGTPATRRRSDAAHAVVDGRHRRRHAGRSTGRRSAVTFFGIAGQRHPDRRTSTADDHGPGGRPRPDAGERLRRCRPSTTALNTGDAVRYRFDQRSVDRPDRRDHLLRHQVRRRATRSGWPASYCNAVGAAGDAATAPVSRSRPIDLTVPDRRRRRRSTASPARSVASSTARPTTCAVHHGFHDHPGRHAGRRLASCSMPPTDRAPHRLGIVEIDLERADVRAGASTTQALFANLTTNCTVPAGTPASVAPCGRLLAPSGQPLSSVAPAAGDGISTASAAGRHRRDRPASPSRTPTITGSPSVALTIGALPADRRRRRACSPPTRRSRSGASADTAGGGVISVGKAESQRRPRRLADQHGHRRRMRRSRPAATSSPGRSRTTPSARRPVPSAAA